MAMNVSFKKGLKAALPSTRDANTFYYVSDEFALYLGDHLISNEVTAAQFTALTNRVSAIETADFQTQINAILETLKSIATSDTVQAIDDRLAEVEKDYLTSEDKTELEGKVTAHETAVNTKFESYSTTEQMNAAIDADVKVVTDYIADNEAAWLEKYDDTDLKAAQKLVDEAQDKALTDYKAEMVTAMANADAAAQGYASAAESAAKGYADQKLLDFENAYIKADDNNTIDKLNEIAAWITDDEAGATKIISDVATNAANIKTINESAVMTSGITATKVGEYDTVKSTVDTNKLTWDKASTALQADDLSAFEASFEQEHSDVLNSGVTPAKFDQLYNGTKATVDANKSIWDMAATALQPAVLILYSTTEQMNAAITTATTDMATNASVEAKIGVSASVENGPTGVYAAIQGATTNTVKDCVDGINALNAGSAQANKDISAISTSVNDVVTQLTWGSF